MKRLPSLWLILLLMQGAAENLKADSAQSSILFHSGAGWYHKAYRSWYYRDRPEKSFSVPMIAGGTEYRHRKNSGVIIGCGVAGAMISQGEYKNWIEIEKQEKTTYMVPYSFLGNDFGSWSLELGLTYYINTTDAAERQVTATDGTVVKETSGLFFTRSDSYVIPNISARILDEKGIHVKIRYGREVFQVVDNIMNIGVVFPAGRFTYEAFISFPSGISSYFPESNQRIGAAASFSMEPYYVGISMGLLWMNAHGGGGLGGYSAVLALHNYNASLFTGVRW